MGILDDTAIFAAVIKNGGFSHAAKYLGLSNGLISRRIAKLESELAVTLIKRTTRQIQLTPEGELLWQHAQRIQEELETAIMLIQSSAKKPKGTIKISAPLYFGREYLTPMILKFLNSFNDIKVELDLSNEPHDLINEKLDLVIRGAGYINEESLKTSNIRMKFLLRDDIRLYASENYLQKYGEPQSIEELSNHIIISYIGSQKFLEQVKWKCSYNDTTNEIVLTPKFKCNDVESAVFACISGYGIGKFTTLSVKKAVHKQRLFPILQTYHWGQHNLYALYSNQKNLPLRTRLLLDFIHSHVQALEK